MIPAESPTETELILGVSDITGFAKAAAQKSDIATFQLLAELYALTGSIIEPAGGRIVKFIGDTTLMVFPIDAPQDAVSALRALQARTADVIARFGPECRLKVRVHTGRVAYGMLGTATEKRFDIIGRAVNSLFLMPNAEFAISPELQQVLDRDVR